MSPLLLLKIKIDRILKNCVNPVCADYFVALSRPFLKIQISASPPLRDSSWPWDHYLAMKI